MLFNSVHFLFFFPIVVLFYYLIPQRFRWIWLLIASYYFYMSWNPTYAVLIFTSTVVTYLCSILIEKFSKQISDEDSKKKREKWVVAGSLAINLGILFFYKYFNFINESLKYTFSELGITYEVSNLDILLPVGISFYTFQALGYTIDVYRGNIKAERNLGKYALFVSFFPQLVAGPIERSTNLLPQFYNKQSLKYENVKSGLLLILWGIFQKLMIADRLAIVVNTVYNDVDRYEGFHLIIATIFFSFQILCDFSAYSDIAIGASKVLGFDLMKNFDRPYFSKSIREFWRRWHISLSTWFKDYLYFPLGGSRGGKLQTYRNILIVFVVSGLWHGANWTFLVWGLLHGVFQVISLMSEPYLNKVSDKVGLQKESFSLKLLNVFSTFLLVSFAWIFFRANSINDAFYVVNNLFVFNPEVLFTDALYNLGMDAAELRLSVYTILLVLLVHYLQRNRRLREEVQHLWLPIRWSLYTAAIVAILIFGIYGSAYDASQFLYFQF